jgi:hypothetical protein
MDIEVTATCSIALFAALMLAACHKQTERASIDTDPISACMQKLKTEDDYVLTTTCEPLGPEQAFNGTWFVGFELSSFRPGYLETPADIRAAKDTYQIIAPKSVDAFAHARDELGRAAYQISFKGRKSQPNSAPGDEIIVMDEIEEVRAVALKARAPAAASRE